MRKLLIAAALLLAAFFTSADRASAFHRPPPYFYLGYYPPYAVFYPWNWTAYYPAYYAPVYYTPFYAPAYYPVYYPYYYPAYYFPIRQVIVPVYGSSQPKLPRVAASERRQEGSTLRLTGHQSSNGFATPRDRRGPVSELNQPGRPMRYVGIKPD